MIHTERYSTVADPSVAMECPSVVTLHWKFYFKLTKVPRLLCKQMCKHFVFIARDWEYYICLGSVNLFIVVK